MKKTIFIYNDGTGQSLGSENPTNVAKLYQFQPGIEEKREFADGFRVDPANGNISIYIRGVGTVDSQYIKDEEPSGFFKKLWYKIRSNGELLAEQAFGSTIVDRVKRSYELFKTVYKEGDEIVLVGFSRGAASIRILASEIVKRHNVKIKYMLVFDTVYSVIGDIAILDNPPMKRFETYDISPNIEKCDHLIAGDEMREKFPFSPVKKREGVRQILFAGSHSDVGGGHKSTGLSDISLKFAIEQMKSLGYEIAEAVAEELKPDPKSDITFVVLGGTGQKHYPRQLNQIDFVVHKSVIERSKAKGTVSIALAQLSSFDTTSPEVLVHLKDINSRFDL